MLFSSLLSSGFGPRVLLIVLFSILLALSGCREKTPVVVSQFKAFGTRVDVSLVGVNREQAKQASVLLAENFAYLERDWTSTDSGPLPRVNRLLASNEPFVAPPSLVPLVRQCQTYEAQSNGLFNPAIGKLMELWGFDNGPLSHHPPPTSESIERLVKAAPSMAQIEIEGLMLKGDNRELQLDFHLIAKGYAIDLAMRHLLDLGVRNALIQAGGQLRAIGDRSGQPWRVPIRRTNSAGVFAVIAIRGDESVATSTEYDRNFIFEGKPYHAIIDPRTGWPADQTRSVTVVHNGVADAAAAATALFIAGPQAWRTIAENMSARFVLLVDMAGKVHMTRAMADRIELVDHDEEEVFILDEPALAHTASASAAL